MKKTLIRSLALVVLIGLGLIVYVVTQLNRHALLAPYSRYVDSISSLIVSKPTLTHTAAPMRVTFMGVSTLLFDDGETAFMTDGFFTRPALSKLRSVAPDVALIKQSLAQAKVTQLAAVIPLHSHYDHAMDSPIVAKLTHAQLIGSNSSANIGKGYGLAQAQIKTVKDGEVMQLGRFKLTFIHSVHSPTGFATGEILHPLSTPADVTDYKVGDCLTLLVEHEGLSVLVQASAGFIPNKLAGVKADVVFLGIGGFGKLSKDYQRQYWNEVVRATSPEQLFLIHWDDFFKPLSQPLEPMPKLMDDFDESMQFLIKQANADKANLHIPIAWQTIELMALPL